MHGTVEIPAHLNGPATSANGGIACGEVALWLGVDAEVTLRLPPPLAEPIAVIDTPEGIELRTAADALVATGHRAPLTLVPPAPVDYATALGAVERFAGHREHAFPTCFSCGPGRNPDEALCIHPGPVTPGTRQPVAGPWTPRQSLADPARPSRAHLRYVAAAIDCAGAWAVMSERGYLLLGRMHLSLRAAPRIAERCVVMGWAIATEGRKHFAGTAAYGQDGRLLAMSRQTWIRVAGDKPD